VTKSRETYLEVPIAIHPTIGIVVYPFFSKWIRDHRDFPLKINQR
jgi:prolyl-tRNA synthetase